MIKHFITTNDYISKFVICFSKTQIIEILNIGSVYEHKCAKELFVTN